jgi:flagellar biosynthetic protein FliR
MPDLTAIFPLIVPFLLVLFRLMGMFAFVPFYSNANIPTNVKVLLALAIAFCVWNVVPQVALPASTSTLIGLTVAIAGEMSIGLVIGMLLGCLFMGVQLGAHMVSQQMGLSMATIYDPSFEDQTTVIEQIAFWIAMVAFLGMGGHRQIIDSIVMSYRKVPIGSGGLAPDQMLQMVLVSMDASFHAATRVAMPALVAFFIATLTTGLMSRSMPQLNLMSIGISMHLIVGFIMVGVGLAGWALVSQESFVGMRQALRVLFG